MEDRIRATVNGIETWFTEDELEALAQDPRLTPKSVELTGMDAGQKPALTITYSIEDSGR